MFGLCLGLCCVAVRESLVVIVDFESSAGIVSDSVVFL